MSLFLVTLELWEEGEGGGGAQVVKWTAGKPHSANCFRSWIEGERDGRKEGVAERELATLSL